MKRISLLLLAALALSPSLAFGQGADPELRELVRKIGEHVIRLEEQNKGTQQQLSLLERQMDKRFETIDKHLAMLRENMDKRFDQMTWIQGLIVAMVAGGFTYVVVSLRKLSVLEEQVRHKLEVEDYVKLEKTVEAIKEVLEQEGKRIIVKV